jgi:hypothetical protein
MTLTCLSLTAVLAFGCGGGSKPTRSFNMGFSPWPYDATYEAVDDTWAKIDAHGDIISQHIDAGIPWPEAYAGTPYHANVEGDIQNRVNHTPPGKKVYLAVNCLNTLRDGMGGYWAATQNGPMPAEWASRTFADIETAVAYTNFALDLINRFNPAYFNYAVEITELILKDPTEYAQFVTFSQRVYTAIKTAHPDLPVFVSIALKHPLSAETTTMKTGFASIIDYTDIIGVSTYPYAFYNITDGGNPANLPADWLSQALDYAPGKQFAVTETASIAQDLVIPVFSVDIHATAEWQNDYLGKLLTECNSMGALFVIWFCIVDYDGLWNGVLGQDPLAAVWRDTGLYDETVTARPSLATWDAWLARTK